jgi:hypothetical protein
MLMTAPIRVPDATAEPEAYVRALLDTLGDRDPLQVYDQTRDTVRRACSGLDDSAWARPMAAGEWSADQIVGHLLDVDIESAVAAARPRPHSSVEEDSG